jgi:hypothetical protein
MEAGCVLNEARIEVEETVDVLKITIDTDCVLCEIGLGPKKELTF